MSKKPENSCARKLLAIFALFFSTLSGSAGSATVVKKTIMIPKIKASKGPMRSHIKQSEKVNLTSKKPDKDIKKTGLEYKKSKTEGRKPLFHRPEFDSKAADLATKIMLTSYDARIASVKEQAAVVSALKNLPLPQLSFTFVNNNHGLDSNGSFMSDKNSPDPRQDNGNTLRENISLQATFDLGSAVMGLANTLSEQQLARADSAIQYSELYFNVCKAIQTYCTSLRKLWDCKDQVADFRIDDRDMQSRYKVGSISGISALQSRERLSTAEAKLKEAEINLIIAEKKLRQYTPHITKADLETLHALARTDFKYSKEDTARLKEISSTRLPGVMRGHMRIRKARMSGANAAMKPFLPTMSIEASPKASYPKWVDSKVGANGSSSITFKTSWTMGVQTLADMGNNVLESRKTALEAEKEIQQSITDLNAAIEKYEQSIMVVELCRSKVESCKVRLAQHEAMDQNEPEAHIEKRSKFKEELYKAKSEFEEAKERLSFAFLESMLLSGELLSSERFSDQVIKYNNNFKPDGRNPESATKKTYKQFKLGKVKAAKVTKPVEAKTEPSTKTSKEQPAKNKISKMTYVTTKPTQSSSVKMAKK